MFLKINKTTVFEDTLYTWIEKMSKYYGNKLVKIAA